MIGASILRAAAAAALACCLATGVMTAGETFFVRVRPGALPSALALPPTATSVVLAPSAAKMADRAQSVELREAWDRLGRTIVVTVDDDGRWLRDLPAVEAVYPNRRITIHDAVTDDSLSADQYALPRVGAVAAWKVATGAGIAVGVLDTGIDWTHPDLRDRLWVNGPEDANGNGRFEPWSTTTVIGGLSGDLNGVDDDGNGYVDDVIGFDFVDQAVRNLGDDRDRDPVPLDEQGHGTSVSGVVAATANNGIGIAGLAYGARIATLRAFDATGNGEEDDIAAALLYAATNGLDIVNMSFGDGADSPVMRDACTVAARAGCLLIASAGNTGQESRQYPASYDDVWAIGATTASDSRAGFSSTGPVVTMSAPGNDIWTTQVGGTYRSVNGTSFAAPYVAAAAALLKERRPSWSADELIGTLREHSLDLGEVGWDGAFGDGRLQADAALAAPGPSAVRLFQPAGDTEIDLRLRMRRLPIVGRATAALFRSWSVDLRAEGTDTWQTLLEGADQRNGELGTFDPTVLAPGNYVIRLAVRLTNGRTIEDHHRLRVTSAILEIDVVDVRQAWKDDRSVLVVTARTSRPATLALTATAGDWQERYVDHRYSGRLHSMVLDGVPAPEMVTLHLVASTNAGDTARASAVTGTVRRTMPLGAAIGKGSTPYVGYMLNDVRDLYGDGSASIVMNDLSNGGFGRMIVIQPDGSRPSWFVRDSIDRIWIPRAIGDANGDGLPEVFAHVVRQAILFQASTPGGSVFESVLFADSTTGLNAAGMADLDGDGREELLCLGTRGLVALTYRNGTFVELGRFDNPTPPAAGQRDNRVDEISIGHGDLDGDGNVEVVFSDTDGDLVVVEWKNGAFRQEFVSIGPGIGGSGFVTCGDLDDDGRPEIVFGVPDDTQPDANGDYGRNLWTYRAFKAVQADSYRTVWTDHIAGVRYGTGYRNGVVTGQLDMRGGDEVVISAYPRLYVFRWDADSATLRPFWYTDDAVVPRPVIADVDGNGVNELYFGTTVAESGFMVSTRFVEFDTVTSRLPIPTGLRAQWNGPTSATVSWNVVSGASAYRVELAAPGASFQTAAETTTPSLTVDTLRQGGTYRFRVVALGMPAESARSAILILTVPTPAVVVDVQPPTVTTEALEAGAVLTVTMSQPVRQQPYDAARMIATHGGVTVAAATVQPDGLTRLRVLLPAIRPAAGEALLVQMPSYRAADGMPMSDTVLTIAVDVVDRIPDFMLRRLAVLDERRVRLWFNEPYDPATASSSGNYRLTPASSERAIAAVDVEGGDSLVLTFSDEAGVGPRGRAYYVTVAADVRTADGQRTMTTGAGNTLGFTLAATAPDDAYAYPHPVLLSQHETVTFANLPSTADVEVLNQRFDVLVRLRERDGNGGIAWNLRTDAGERIPPGIYLYRVTSDGTSGLFKLVIRR